MMKYEYSILKMRFWNISSVDSLRLLVRFPGIKLVRFEIRSHSLECVFVSTGSGYETEWTFSPFRSPERSLPSYPPDPILAPGHGRGGATHLRRRRRPRPILRLQSPPDRLLLAGEPSPSPLLSLSP
jgi:hypothetical protein